jgi:hypothetical protein
MPTNPEGHGTFSPQGMTSNIGASGSGTIVPLYPGADPVRVTYVSQSTTSPSTVSSGQFQQRQQTWSFSPVEGGKTTYEGMMIVYNRFCILKRHNLIIFCTQ